MARIRSFAVGVFVCCVLTLLAGFVIDVNAQFPIPGPRITIPRIKLPGTKSVTLSKPFPGFQLKDANGKTWRNADLKGKTTYIMLWSDT